MGQIGADRQCLYMCNVEPRGLVVWNRAALWIVPDTRLLWIDVSTIFARTHDCTYFSYL